MQTELAGRCASRVSGLRLRWVGVAQEGCDEMTVCMYGLTGDTDSISQGQLRWIGNGKVRSGQVRRGGWESGDLSLQRAGENGKMVMRWRVWGRRMRSGGTLKLVTRKAAFARPGRTRPNWRVGPEQLGKGVSSSAVGSSGGATGGSRARQNPDIGLDRHSSKQAIVQRCTPFILFFWDHLYYTITATPCRIATRHSRAMWLSYYL